VAVVLGLLAGGASAMAQQLSQAQISTIKQACRGDYMKHCIGVPTGGAAALQCLQAHAANVSPPCQEALVAAKPPASAPAAAGPVQPRAATATPSAQPAVQEGVATWPHTRTIEGASVTVYEP
jgi:hypothetical protein